VYRTRRVVERAAAHLIMEREVGQVADRLAEAYDEMKQAAGEEDRFALSEADLYFHEVFVQESGSLRLARMSRTLLVETRMCLSAMAESYEFPQGLAEEHGEIVAAVRARDEDRLLALLDEHIADALQRLTSAYSDRER
jgi:DNA-binding GntR family transcriptional regulator